MQLQRTALTLASILLASAPQAQSTDDTYNKAYVLENEGGDYTGASSLYEKLLGRELGPEMRAKVEDRLAICIEELACSDFAGLMPENPLFYVELNQPGDQLESLLEEIGLLQMAREAAGDGGGQGISPALVQGVLGMRGAAVAITGVNPSTGQPTGVGILHPGDLDLVRGLIETALPNGTESAGELGGFPTYSIGGEGYVTMTKRMVIASSHKREIRRVLERLNGEEATSLAGNPKLTAAMGNRSGSLLTFCVNPSPLVPLAKMAAASEPEAAIAMAVCDPSSFETIVGRLGVQGRLSLDLALNMTEGHSNLVYDFLRMPPIQHDTLARVPAGVAGLFAGALNPARHYTTDHAGRQYVSFMDIGRELFGNVASFAFYTLPPNGEVTHASHGPMPDAGVILTVNDPDKTRGLWYTLLGLGSMAAGGGGEMTGETFDAHGVQAQRFAMPEGISVYGAVSGHELHLASTRRALEASLSTRAGGKSVLEDQGMKEALAAIDPSSNLAAVMHAGRCLELGLMWAPENERDEIEMVLPHVADTKGGLVISHGENSLRLSLAVTDLPDVGQLVAKFHGGGHGGQHGGEHDHYGESDAAH